MPAERATSTYLTGLTATPLRKLAREPTRAMPAVFKNPRLEITEGFLSREVQGLQHLAYPPQETPLRKDQPLVF